MTATIDVREIERASIREFLRRHREYLIGRVLDYGAGRQPYRSFVAGEYVPFDRAGFPGAVIDVDLYENAAPLHEDWDAILCTQVVQYVPYPEEILHGFRDALAQHEGHLILTGPTNWPEVEREDLHRHTKSGISKLLTEAGFAILNIEDRHYADLDGLGRLSFGYAVLAQVSE